jgi:tetratricopeptide (TPR) repeat protein
VVYDGKFKPMAVQEFQKAIQLNPKSALSYYLLGYQYATFTVSQFFSGPSEEGRIMERNAISAYSKAIAIDSRMTSAYLQRANSFAHLDRFREAIEDYGAVIQFDPTNDRALNDRAVTYLNAKAYREAASDCGKALEYRTNRGLKFEFARAFGYKGDAEAALSQHKDAIDSYSQAIKCTLLNLMVLLSVEQIRSLYPEYNSMSSVELAHMIRRVFLPDIEGDAAGEWLLTRKGFFSISNLGELFEKRGDAYLRLGNYQLAARDFQRIFKGIPDLAKTLNRWRFVNEGNDGEQRFLDVKTIEFGGNQLVGLWFKTIYKDKTSSVTLFRLNCSTRKVREESQATYGKNGELLNSSDVGASWRTIIPDTFGETMYSGGCSSMPQ